MTEQVESPPGRIIGVEEKPRALLSWEGPAAEKVAEVLALHAPTIREISSLRSVREDDYDLLVTNRASRLTSNTEGSPVIAGHLFLISFLPSNPQGYSTVDHLAPNLYVRSDRYQLANSVCEPGNLLGAVRDLVSDDLVPAVRARPGHTYFVVADWRQDVDAEDLVIEPFLLTTPPEPKILAGRYQRSDVSEAWILPDDLKRPWEWVAAAVQHWAVTHGRFPLVGGWWELARWQTGPEAEASARRAARKAELAAATARLEAEVEEATAALHDARREATGGLRRLLTEKGDPLKFAVIDALGRLGYEVVDRDDEEPPTDKAGKVEDLGAIDPDDESADPLIEVKGYDAGARAGDLASMLRHLSRASHAGRSPTAIWWVANHFRKRAPDDRPPVLANEEAMIADHAGEDVPLVVIDTRDLFLAVRAVEDGRATPADVRRSLRSARGRWEGRCSRRREDG